MTSTAYDDQFAPDPTGDEWKRMAQEAAERADRDWDGVAYTTESIVTWGLGKAFCKALLELEAATARADKAEAAIAELRTGAMRWLLEATGNTVGMEPLKDALAKRGLEIREVKP